MNKQYEKELAKIMALIDDPKLMESFLHNILTPGELIEVSKRLQIFKMLHGGVSQRKVAKKLGVSLGTISRGSRELKYGEKGIVTVLNNFIKV